jgi:hypothetical protein
MKTNTQEIANLESCMDSAAGELFAHATPETKAAWHVFSEAIQTDLRAKFGDVFENFPEKYAPTQTPN